MLSEASEEVRSRVVDRDPKIASATSKLMEQVGAAIVLVQDAARAFQDGDLARDQKPGPDDPAVAIMARLEAALAADGPAP